MTRKGVAYFERYWTLTEGEIALAASMWKLGMDTYDIAKKLKVHESVIYGRLNLIKAAG